MIEIDTKKCTGCGNCVEACPFGVLKIKDGKAVVANPKKCMKCCACERACPNNAIEVK